MVLTRTFETEHKKNQKNAKTQNIKIEAFKIRILTSRCQIRLGNYIVPVIDSRALISHKFRLKW